MHYYHFYLPWVSSPDDMLPEHAPVYSYPFAPRPLKTIFVVIDFTSLNIKNNPEDSNKVFLKSVIPYGGH